MEHFARIAATAALLALGQVAAQATDRFNSFPLEGWWWAINDLKNGSKPEPVWAFRDEVADPAGDQWVDVLTDADIHAPEEFEKLMPIDTSKLPDKPDANSPRGNEPGYYWARVDWRGLVRDESKRIRLEIVIIREGPNPLPHARGNITPPDVELIRKIDVPAWPERK
jgi:hypothetical protein